MLTYRALLRLVSLFHDFRTSRLHEQLSYKACQLEVFHQIKVSIKNYNVIIWY